jgi:hypothetical protein
MEIEYLEMFSKKDTDSFIVRKASELLSFLKELGVVNFTLKIDTMRDVLLLAVKEDIIRLLTRDGYRNIVEIKNHILVGENTILRKDGVVSFYES